MRGLSSRKLFLIVFAAALAVSAPLVWQLLRDHPSEVRLSLFDDVTASSGIAYVGMTHGAAWGTSMVTAGPTTRG